MAKNKKTPPIKAAPVTQSHGYADALRIGSLTELEKQWLYWREPSRRDAERARPWNTYRAERQQKPPPTQGPKLDCTRKHQEGCLA